MQGYPPNQPPGGGYPPGPPPGGGSPYGYGAPPPAPGYGPQGYGYPGYPGAPMVSPQAPYGIEPRTGLPYSDKSKVIAGVLQIFLPGFGAGRFYTGHVGIAVAQLLVSMFTCVGVIWPIVDGIMMLTGKVTDSEGRPLRDG